MKPKADYASVTESIIRKLEEGVVPWKACWTMSHRNYASQKPYRGINQMLLWVSSMVNKFHSPYWTTFKQARDREAHVMKGSKGTQIIFWKMLEKRLDNGEVETIPMMRLYTVFNLDQIAGLPRIQGAEPTGELNTLLENYLTLNKIGRGLGNPAYSPKLDTLYFPPSSFFTRPEMILPTLAHECIHSTGHPSRLGRFDLDKPPSPFGSPDYSTEELVAELGAAFLCAETGTDSAATLDDSAAYLAHWIKTLKEDPKILVSVAGQAQKAVDRILTATTKEEEPVEPILEEEACAGI